MMKPPLLLLLAASVAQASSFEVQGLSFKPLGWTRDSQFFAWTEDAASDVPGNAKAGFVFSARAGRVTQIDDFAPWLAAHPLIAPKPSRTSPDGKAKAEVKLIPSQGGAGTWDGNTWSPSSQQSFELRVVRDGKSTLSMNVDSAYDVDPYWAPDSLRVAWVVNPWDRTDETTAYTLGIGSAGGPRVHLLADKSTLAKAGPAVASAIEKAGFAPLYMGLAKKARDASVVYAAAGSEEAAAKIAAAVPGGATVDKLSWETQADVVVAIGKSAAKGGK